MQDAVESQSDTGVSMIVLGKYAIICINEKYVN